MFRRIRRLIHPDPGDDMLDPSLRKIPVNLGSRSYNIILGSGIISDLPRHIPKSLRRRRACLVSDTRVYELYGEWIHEILVSSGLEISLIPPVIIPPGERSKSLKQFRRCQDHLIKHRFTRNDFIIGLGGGVPLDLAGFVAATYMRGIPVMHIPTTILAQADASVGGKTAINMAGGKNLVGAFHQPELVYSDLDMLTTLPLRQMKNGMAEVIKMAILGDGELFQSLDSLGSSLYRKQPAALADALATCCRLKAHIVARDEKEAGIRAWLNLGHTLGHALENLPGEKKWLHGEAVALGMVAAARVSVLMKLAVPDLTERIETVLKRFRLPVRTPPVSRDIIFRRLAVDKKRHTTGLRMVLPVEIGRVVIQDDVPEHVVRDALVALFQRD